MMEIIPIRCPLGVGDPGQGAQGTAGTGLDLEEEIGRYLTVVVDLDLEIVQGLAEETAQGLDQGMPKDRQTRRREAQRIPLSSRNCFNLHKEAVEED